MRFAAAIAGLGSLGARMNEEPPPELKSFHAHSMFRAFLIALIPVSAWSWACYRQKANSSSDELQWILGGIFMGGVGLLIITMLSRATFSLPRCPKCQRRMKEAGTINITKKTILNFRTKTRWRIVECSDCNERHRIPGLSYG